MNIEQKPKIVIELDSFLLKDAMVAVYRAAIEHANFLGGKQQDEIGDWLGISGSSVSKMVNKYKIPWKRPKTKLELKEEQEIEKAMQLLKSKGFAVSVNVTKDTPSDSIPITKTKF